MAGIYIHIPYCRQACHYCDFHFSTNLSTKSRLISALVSEIKHRSSYLLGEKIKSVYFGGGTPSVLSLDDISVLLETIYSCFEVEANAEITLEANPDDLTAEKIKIFKSTPINRFSIGVQSFFEEDLRWMNRVHTSKEAARSILLAQESGFENITIDLIYGYPLLSNQKWTDNLEKAIKLNVPHVSAYCITVEPQTALAHFIKKNRTPQIDDEHGALQFGQMVEMLSNAGFVQYELSNFGKDGFFALHNSNYWKGEAYLGVGPSAHSYNHKARHWNISNNHKYIGMVQDDNWEGLTTEEVLTKNDEFNEYVMTGLRTIWGIDANVIVNRFGSSFLREIEGKLNTYETQGLLKEENKTIKLTDSGKLFADKICADLFILSQT